MKENGEEMFFNRELSWIDFNRRVLSEARQLDVPLLERLKFLSITASNFDEFFMVRVASLRRAVRMGDLPFGATMETPSAQLKKILALYSDFVLDQYNIYSEITSQLREESVRILQPGELSQEQLKNLEVFFNEELFNVISPVKVEPKRPFPFTAGLRMNLAFLIEPEEETWETPSPVIDTGDELPDEEAVPENQKKLIIVEIPAYLQRFHRLVPSSGHDFITIEDLVPIFAGRLFKGYKILETLSFRLTRDADIPVDEEKEEDFVEAMNKILQNRLHSRRVRLEIRCFEAKELRQMLIDELEIDTSVVFDMPGPINLKDFMGLAFMPFGEKLKYKAWEPAVTIDDNQDIWKLIREKDVLLYHPYEAFSPVVRLLREAAEDPDVLCIRMTLYRTGGDSPIVQALARAAEMGKQVLVLMELKARFDEEQNLGWAQTLEKAGGIVIYGVANLKVHSKAMMIIRREEDGIRRYAHLGTGNYHDKTSRLYTDLGLLTSRNEYTMEVANFFNAITGYSAVGSTHYLAMAPHHLKQKVLALIQWLIDQKRAGNPARILAKMNALADEDVILALYQAAEAGVEIKLNIRGICMLNPGYVSNGNIEVVSIVDRFLEHARIFYFEAGDHGELFLSSADWMYRNLERRVELMFSVIQDDLRERILHILEVLFSDNVKTHRLMADGTWVRMPADKNPVQAQVVFHQETEEWKKIQQVKRPGELSVRRK